MISADFPTIDAVIRDGIERKLHTGVQICVHHRGQTILDAASGDAAPGRPLTPDDAMLWRSAGKPLTAVLVLREIEQARLTPETPLADLLQADCPTEFRSITLRHLLTHTAGFPDATTGWPHTDWETSIRMILQTPPQYPPGTAAYHPQSSWFVLGEVLRRLRSGGCSFEDILRREILQPLGMDSTFASVRSLPVHVTEDRLPVLYERSGGRLVESPLTGGVALTHASPGGSLRGPVRDLARFYQSLLRTETRPPEPRVLNSESVAEMTRPHRCGQFDQTFQHVVDFGLGVIVDSNHHGAETVPYGFSTQCSPCTFGHGGAQCAMAFCDPVNELVVAWAANGFCGEGQHQRRNRLLNDAVYRDVLGRGSPAL